MNDKSVAEGELLPEQDDSVDRIAYVEGVFAGFLTVGAMLFFDLAIGGLDLLAIGGIGLGAASIWEYTK